MKIAPIIFIKINSEIVTGRRAITADNDLCPCEYVGLSEGWWVRGKPVLTPRWRNEPFRRNLFESSSVH